MASHQLPCLYVICDHDILRTGYRSLVRSSARIRLVGEGDHETTLEEVQDTGANVLAVDASTLDRRGLRTAKRLKNQCPELTVVLLSTDNRISEKHVRNVEADGHISLGNDVSSDEFITAVIDRLTKLPDTESPST